MQENPNLHSESLQAIYEAGGHFVLAKENKRPHCGGPGTSCAHLWTW